MKVQFRTADGVSIDVNDRVMRIIGGPDFAALAIASELAARLKMGDVGYLFDGGDRTGITLTNRDVERRGWHAWDYARLASAIREICARPAWVKITT